MNNINTKIQKLLLGLAFILIHLFILEPIVLDGLVPQGVDVIGSVGEIHQIQQYNKKSGEVSLWNPYIFSGMPRYFRIIPQIPSFDTLVNQIGKIFNEIFLWYLVGGFSFFYLMRYKGLTIFSSFFGAFSFTLFPHYQALWAEGHFTKFRAIMMLPLVIFAAHYFFNNRDILGAVLFAITFGNQIRTQHYQIVFYTALLIFSIGVYPFLKDIIERKWRKLIHSISLLLASLICSLCLSAQPLFLAGEYLPFSSRGANTVDLSKDMEDQSILSGLDFKYATQWSTHPSSIYDWLIPRFHGGMSTELYDGDKYPNLKGRNIPGYWGQMPFTQSYEYFGPLLFMLIAIGLFYYRDKNFIRSIAIFCVFLILLSFGRHFPSFYNLFFYYLPYFKNFRAPMMSITITAFIFSILCSYGFHAVSEKITLKDKKVILTICSFFFVIGVFIFFLSSGYSFSKFGEQLESQVAIIVKNIRAEFFFNDLKRYFFILFISSIAIGLIVMKPSIKTGAMVFLFCIIIIDFSDIQSRKKIKYVNKNRLIRNHFMPTETDKWLLKQDGIFRVLPLGRLFGDNRWSYFHQSVGGYSAIKMNRTEEIIKNCLYKNIDGTLGVNENILKILNIKFIVSPGLLSHPQLIEEFRDPTTKWVTYRYNNYLKRAYFPESYVQINSARDRLKTLNDLSYDPLKTVIIEKKIDFQSKPLFQNKTKLLEFSPNLIRYELKNDQDAVLVLSETPYAPGWKAKINNEHSKIFNANHVNMAVIIPKGENILELNFHPKSFFNYRLLELVTAISLYIILIGIIYSRKRHKKTILVFK